MRVWIMAALLFASAAEFAFAQLVPLSPRLTYDAAALRANAPMADLSGAVRRHDKLTP